MPSEKVTTAQRRTGEPSANGQRSRRTLPRQDFERPNSTETSSMQDLLALAPRKLMTREEETDLATQRDDALTRLNELNPHVALSALYGIQDYSEAYRTLEGDALEALKAYRGYLNQFIERNLRLIPFVIKKYGLVDEEHSEADLFQMGIIGLDFAARKFDHRRKRKFSTYSTNWIRQSIVRAKIDDGGRIRLPVHMHDTLKRIDKERARFYQEEARYPTEEELANRVDMPVKRLQEHLDLRPRFVMLDAPLRDGEGDAVLGDVIPGDVNVEEEVLGRENKTSIKIIELMKECLEENEFFAYVFAHGLGGIEPKSNEQIARRLKIETSQVSVLLSHTYAKLMHPTFRARLHEITGDL